MMMKTTIILIAVALTGCSGGSRDNWSAGSLAGRWMSDKMEHYSITLEHAGSMLRGTGQSHGDVVNAQFSFLVSGEVSHSPELGEDVVTLVYTSTNHPAWNQTNLFKVAKWGGSGTRCLQGIMGTTDVLLDHAEEMKHYKGAQHPPAN